MKKNYLISIFIFFLLIACENKQEKKQNEIDSVTAEETIVVDEITVQAKINSFLINEYLKSDSEFMNTSDRMYSYDIYDLNNDNKEEIFIGLISPYFCGTGGCTMLILNSDFSLNSKITVVEFPIFISENLNNGWKDLILLSNGNYHLLKFTGKKYPSNPSVEEVIEINSSINKIELLSNAYEDKIQF